MRRLALDTLGQVKSVIQGMTSVIDIEPFDIMKYVAVGANTKMCRVHYGGLMINGQCYERVAIAGVCMTIQDTSAGWQPPPAGRRGCFGSPMEVLFGKSCPGSHAHLTSDDPTCDFSLANMTLRSLHDPHEVALSLTSGTLNFGLTPHENWVQGMVMLVIGCVLLLPVIPSCCLYIHSKRRSQRTCPHSLSPLLAAPTTAGYGTTTFSSVCERTDTGDHTSCKSDMSDSLAAHLCAVPTAWWWKAVRREGKEPKISTCLDRMCF